MAPTAARLGRQAMCVGGDAVAGEKEDRYLGVSALLSLAEGSNEAAAAVVRCVAGGHDVSSGHSSCTRDKTRDPLPAAHDAAAHQTQLRHRPELLLHAGKRPVPRSRVRHCRCARAPGIQHVDPSRPSTEPANPASFSALPLAPFRVRSNMVQHTCSMVHHSPSSSCVHGDHPKIVQRQGPQHPAHCSAQRTRPDHRAPAQLVDTLALAALGELPRRVIHAPHPTAAVAPPTVPTIPRLGIRGVRLV